MEFSILLTTFDSVYFESRDAIIPPLRIPKIVRIANAKTYFHERLLYWDIRLTLSPSQRGSLFYAFNTSIKEMKPCVNRRFCSKFPYELHCKL